MDRTCYSSIQQAWVKQHLESSAVGGAFVPVPVAMAWSAERGHRSPICSRLLCDSDACLSWPSFSNLCEVNLSQPFVTAQLMSTVRPNRALFQLSYGFSYQGFTDRLRGTGNFNDGEWRCQWPPVFILSSKKKIPGCMRRTCLWTWVRTSSLRGGSWHRTTKHLTRGQPLPADRLSPLVPDIMSEPGVSSDWTLSHSVPSCSLMDEWRWQEMKGNKRWSSHCCCVDKPLITPNSFRLPPRFSSYSSTDTWWCTRC